MSELRDDLMHKVLYWTGILARLALALLAILIGAWMFHVFFCLLP